MKAETDMASSEHEEGIPDADAGAQGTDLSGRGARPGGKVKYLEPRYVKCEMRVGYPSQRSRGN